MNSSDKLKILRGFNEEQLIDNVVMPLLEEMGFKDITRTHGVREKGLDLVFCEKTKFGEREYTGVQIKAKRIHGSSSKPGNATEILNQAQQAFLYFFPDVSDGTPKNIERYTVMTSGDIIVSARDLIKDGLKSVGCYKTINFFDGRKLVELIDQYMPSFLWEEYDHLNKYLQAMKKEFETIRDISAIGQREPIPLEEIYVSLKLSRKDGEILREQQLIEEEMANRGILEEHQVSEKREQTLNAADVTDKFTKVVIVGAPGSGKTTLLKYLTLKSCKENIETQERTVVPVFITLRQYLDSGKSMREYIDDIFEHYKFPKAKELIEADLKEGKCLLFLDGFDELPSKERQEKVTKGIEAVIHTYPKNRFVVTSRTAGYHGELKGFDTVEVMPFDDHQIEQFITNWFRESDPGRAKSMGGAVKASESIRELARNPLMIAIIANIYEEDNQLPQRRVKLYERCLEVLLSKWDFQKKIKSTYDAEAKQRILRKVALKAHSEGKRSFAKETLLRRFEEYLPEVRIEKDKAEDVLTEIVQRNVLLKEVSIDVYEFLHLSFQEYLAALELRERRDYDTLLDHLYESWWEEVVLLFAGFDRDATELLEKIIEKERTDERFKEDMFYSNLTLKGKCIADADYTREELRNKIIDDLRSLYQTAEFWPLRERAMKIISSIESDSITSMLIEELSNESSGVRGRTAEAPEEIGSEKDVDSLIEALTNESSGVRRSVAYRLRRIGSEKAVDPLIKALEDEDSGVRGWAAEALGRIGSEKAVDPLIKALEDEDSGVRWKAAYALGEIGSEKAVDPLIKALEDEDSYVRGWAAYALGEIGSEKAVDSLKKALRDEGKGIFGKVKDQAFDSLEKISKSLKSP